MSNILPANVYDRILDPRAEDIGLSELWNRLFFYPGRPPQSAELNELATILFNVSDRLGRTLFREGSRISGIDIVVKPEFWIAVTDGVMFLDGRPRDILGTPVNDDLQITGVGVEWIALERREEIWGPETHSELLNPVLAPTVGADQFNRRGALRQVYRYRWIVVNDHNPSEIAIKIFEFRDGNLVTSPTQGEYSELLRVLARRTYDESGHYLVNGMVVNLMQSPTDNDKLLCRIDAGKAYVGGYEVLKVSPSVFTMDKAVTGLVVNNETHMYLNGTLLYTLSSRPVRYVLALSAKVARVNVQVVRQDANNQIDGSSFDDLFSVGLVSPRMDPDSPTKGISIDSIQKISLVMSGLNNYTEGADYILADNKIIWQPGGNRPGPGVTYFVDLRLVRELTKGRRVRTLVAQETVTHAAHNGVDNLAHNDLLRVTRVWDNNVTYVEGVDYRVGSGRTSSLKGPAQIDWSVGGAEPAATAQYYVAYEYWDHLPGREGDYTSVDCYYDTDDITSAHQYLETYKYGVTDENIQDQVDLRTAGGERPIHQTDMIADYEYYVPRRDIVSLNPSGEFVIHKGIPAREPQYPVLSLSTLPIAYLDIPANSAAVLVTYPETRRHTMADIWQIRDMLDAQVYNSALEYLESLAMFDATPLSKKMILVDPFIDFSRADYTYNLGGIAFNCSVDPETGAIALPLLYGTRILETWNTQQIYENFVRTLMTRFTDAVLLFQGYATGYHTLVPNPDIFESRCISITPSEVAVFDLVTTPDVRLDARTDRLIPVVEADLRAAEAGTLNRYTRVFNRVRKSVNRFFCGGTKIVEWTGTSPRNRAANIYHPPLTLSPTSSDLIVGSRALDRIDDRILDRSVIPIMDTGFSIVVESTDWYPSVDNIKVYFDGVQVAATAAPQYQGSTPGTLKSDSNGRFIGSFTVPPRTRIGRREVRVTSLKPPSTTDYTSATTIFASEGLRQVHNTSFISVNVVSTREWREVDIINPIKKVEPLAQTFFSPRNTWITAVGLYFRRRPANMDSRLVVQIRDVDEAGEPTPNVIAQKEVQAVNVVPDSMGNLETLVRFDDPVYLQEQGQYALVLISEYHKTEADDPDFEVMISKLGLRDIRTTERVSKNPDAGVLFTSVGGRGWVKSTDTDIKFRVYEAQFDPTTLAVVVFKNITNVSSGQSLRNATGEVNIPHDVVNAAQLPNKYSKFIHVVSQFAPPGARVIWSYSMNNGLNWVPYTPGKEVSMNTVPNQLQLKCEMDMQQVTGLTPTYLLAASAAVNRNHNSLILIANEASGRYVSHNVQLSSPASTLRVMFITNVAKAAIAPSARAELYYSLNNGSSWNLVANAGATELVLQGGWYERKYEVPGLAISQLRLRIDMYNSDVMSADPMVRALRVVCY